MKYYFQTITRANRWNKGWMCCEYRRDPVPYTACRSGKGGGCFRNTRTAQEKRANARSPGFKGYNRTKRQNLPTDWDDIPKEWKRNWKDSTKKKRQWM